MQNFCITANRPVKYKILMNGSFGILQKKGTKRISRVIETLLCHEIMNHESVKEINTKKCLEGCYLNSTPDDRTIGVLIKFW